MFESRVESIVLPSFACWFFAAKHKLNLVYTLPNQVHVVGLVDLVKCYRLLFLANEREKNQRYFDFATLFPATAERSARVSEATRIKPNLNEYQLLTICNGLQKSRVRNYGASLPNHPHSIQVSVM